MRFNLIIILWLIYSSAVFAQEDKHLKGKAIDISYYTLQGRNDDNLTIFLDGYKLKSNEKEMIGKHCEKFNFKFLNDSTVYIKSKFVYYIDGTIYRGRKRQDKLKDDMTILEVLSQKEAKDKLGIRARYGLIHMEAK